MMMERGTLDKLIPAYVKRRATGRWANLACLCVALPAARRRRHGACSLEDIGYGG